MQVFLAYESCPGGLAALLYLLAATFSFLAVYGPLGESRYICYAYLWMPAEAGNIMAVLQHSPYL